MVSLLGEKSDAGKVASETSMNASLNCFITLRGILKRDSTNFWGFKDKKNSSRL